MSKKGCISCVHCNAIRNHYYCGNKRLTEKQVFNAKGYCSNFKNKVESDVRRREENMRWLCEIDCGNVAHYFCPKCKEENEWESPFCPMCGIKLEESEENETGLEIRDDLPETLCFRFDCLFYDWNTGGCTAGGANPLDLYCHKYTRREKS